MRTEWGKVGSRNYRGYFHRPRPAHLWRAQFRKIKFLFKFMRPYLMPRQNIQQMHRDYVPTVPPSFHLLGSTGLTRNQGMVQFSDPDARIPEPDGPIPEIHILTLQGHPEFTTGIVKEIIRARRESGAMDKATAEHGWARADERNDGDRIGRVIWDVLLQRSATVDA
jgi:hypothetical protein